MHLLETKALHKAYKGRTVVGGVSIHISRGEIVGLLGPNGAGKTTTFYMVVGAIRADAGARGNQHVGIRALQRAGKNHCRQRILQQRIAT